MHFISSDSCSFTSEFFQPKTKPEPKVEQRTQILSDQFLPHRFKWIKILGWLFLVKKKAHRDADIHAANFLWK